MSKNVGKFSIIFNRGSHIHHFFETYEEAENYMVNNNFGGFITYVVGHVVSKTEITEKTQKVIDFIGKQKEDPKS